MSRRAPTQTGAGLPQVRPLLVGLALAAVSCASSTQLQQLQIQLTTIQNQLVELQSQAASKEEIEELGSQLSREVERLVEAQAKVEESVLAVRTSVDRQGTELAASQLSIEELVQNAAKARAELQSLRSLIADLGSESTPVPSLLSSDPKELYRRAYSDFESGNYDLARLGFRHYVDSFGSSEQADDALYWIGECYYSQRKYRRAIAEFSTVESRYPTSNRLASALLRKGFAFIALGDTAEGRFTLLGVVESFPRSDEAILAQEQLESLVG